MDQGRILARGRYAMVYAWGEGRVLKLFHEGLPPHLAKREYVATRSVREAGLPVPEPLEVVTVRGRSGLVLERVDGSSMQDLLDAKGYPRTDQVTASARALAVLHASVHDRPVPGLPSQRRMLEEDITDVDFLDGGTREGVLALMARLPDGEAACHGDLHPRNVVMSPGGAVIVDWLAACRGNPAADVARSLLVMEAGQEWDQPRVRELRRQYRSAYLHKYCFQSRIWPEEVRRWRVPVAASRLAEGLPRERRWLVHIIQEGLR